MAYIGNVPAEAYTNTVKDSFNGTGSATAFTLSQPTLTNDVRVVVENVVQDPAVAYNVSGVTLTFTSAPPSGTDNIYVVHLGPAVMTTVPPAEIAGATTFASSVSVQGAFTSLGIDDNATSTAITIDASENVGIGTSSPTANLHVKFDGTDNLSGVLVEGTDSGSVSAPDLTLYRNSTSPADNDIVGGLWFYGNNSTAEQTIYSGIYSVSSDVSDGTEDGALLFSTVGGGGTITERVRIDASGNVGIGASTVDSQFHIEKSQVTSYNGSATDGQLSVGATAFIQQTGGSNTALSQIVFQPRSGYGYNRIVSSGGSAPYMALTTNNAERLRIDASGNLLVGTTTYNAVPPTGQIRYMQWGKASGGRPQLQLNSHSGGGPLLVNSVFADNNNRTIISLYRRGVQVGSITGTNSSTSYNTSSDYRLKKDWLPMSGASERIMALKPVNFAWKADDTRVDGFLAHELAEVVPEAATGTKDAMRDEEYEVTPATEAEEAVKGTRSVPDMQGIDQSKLVPLLTAALQEALAEITALKSRVTALETE